MNGRLSVFDSCQRGVFGKIEDGFSVGGELDVGAAIFSLRRLRLDQGASVPHLALFIHAHARQFNNHKSLSSTYSTTL